MVRLLLKYEQFKKEIRRKHPSSSNTPLHEASLSGNIEIVNELIKKMREKGSLLEDITCQNCNAMSPFHIACREGHKDIVKKLFECIEQGKRKELADDSGKKQKTPLHFACEKGNKDIILMLIRYGATCDKKNIEGTLPIHVAAKYGHGGIISNLLRNTEDIGINAVDNYGNTALNIATRYSRTEMIEKLLEE